MLKPSEAMLAGAARTEPNNGDFFYLDEDGTLHACAVGAMYLGLLPGIEEAFRAGFTGTEMWEAVCDALTPKMRASVNRALVAYVEYYGERVAISNDREDIEREEIALRLAWLGY